MKAFIHAIEYYLPEAVHSTEQLAKEFPDWTVEKIDAKTGIRERHIAAAAECSSDLAVAAAEKLFSSGVCGREEIDYILLCTQSPDYFLPTTACLVQHRLGLPRTAGALDFNLGCSGYVYGLGLAQGLIETGQAKTLLLITAETYSKFMHPGDRSVRTIFGDAASATLLRAADRPDPLLGPFVFGTDGSGADHLIVRAGGMRNPRGLGTVSPHQPSDSNLFMDGPEIFAFSLRVVPQTVSDLLARSRVTLDEIDLFVFHQANRYMLDHLRKRLKIPEEKFFVNLSHCGNTVSSTIPIALKDAQEQNRLRDGNLVMLVGFGVGYSWGACLARWTS